MKRGGVEKRFKRTHLYKTREAVKSPKIIVCHKVEMSNSTSVPSTKKRESFCSVLDYSGCGGEGKWMDCVI